MGTILKLENADFSANKVSIVKEAEWYTNQSYANPGTNYSIADRYAGLALANVNTVSDIIGKEVNVAKIRVNGVGNIIAYKISSNVATQLVTKQVTEEDVNRGYICITWDEKIVFSSETFVCFGPSTSILYDTTMGTAGYGFGSFNPATNEWAESASAKFTMFIDFGRTL
jgi:hypothetical protein